ncbi:MAG: cellulosomal protein [Deltaproteobacteria bacterium]|nr:cellulosomal protein [Deltaproteobacteria bacterium]
MNDLQTRTFPLKMSIFFFAFQLSCGNGSDVDNSSDSGAPPITNTTDTDPPDAGPPDAGNAIERPDGWTDETHGDDAPPNYEVVFPQDAVNRIDIQIAPSDWKAMQSEMEDQCGEFGAAKGMSSVPDEAFEACEGKELEEPCTVEYGGGTVEGICQQYDEETLYCGREYPLPGGYVAPELVPYRPSWVPCTVTFQDKTWWHVGVRFKGNSTLYNSWLFGIYKLPFKLDFDEFEVEHPEVDDQRFHGFKRLSLGSNASDPSLLRDKVAGDLFRASGVPSPWRSFYRVYVDVGDGPTYFGLYTIAEVPDKPMLETQLGNSDGNLYKPDGYGARWTTEDYDEACFPKKLNEVAADWSDIETAISALNASRDNPEKWRADLEKTLNVDGFLNWLAVNTVIQDWDTYGIFSHNYYLYGDTNDAGRLTWIPWDHNLSLHNIKGMLSIGLTEVSERWPLIRYLMDDPVYNDMYFEHVEAIVAGAFDVEEFQKRIQTEHDLIRPHVVGKDGELPDYTDLPDPEYFDLSLDYLMRHVIDRHQAVEDALAER